MGNKSMVNNLTEGNVAKQLLQFSYPFMLANLLQVVYNIVDMIVIGQFVGSTGLSAVSNGGDMVALFIYVAVGFTSACQILIAQYVGSGDKEGMRRSIGTSFSFCTLLSLAMTALSLLGVNWMLDILNTPAQAYAQAKVYSITCFAGFFFTFGYNTVAAVLRGMGDSKHPLIFVLIAAVSNLILDLLFVAVFHWDVFGAALATVMGQAISFIISMIYLYIKRDSFGFDFHIKSFAIDPRTLKSMVKLGIPLAVQHAAIMVSMLFITSYVNTYGVVASAVTGVGNKLRNVMSIITNAIGTAGASMVAQNLGAGKPERVHKIVGVSLTVCVTVATVLSIVFVAVPRLIFSIFSNDPEILAMAPSYAWVLVVYFFSFALMAPFNNVINGVGNAPLSFLVGIMDGVVARVGIAVLVGVVMGYGIYGFWYGSAAAGFVTALIGFIYYISGRWKTHKLLID
jgi:putative MATE family efflux protein